MHIADQALNLRFFEMELCYDRYKRVVHEALNYSSNRSQIIIGRQTNSRVQKRSSVFACRSILTSVSHAPFASSFPFPSSTIVLLAT